jgi:LuxR family transcriptional regulator, quorum-sensing system regulator BjaR1
MQPKLVRNLTLEQQDIISDFLICAEKLSNSRSIDDLRDCLFSFVSEIGFKGYSFAIVRRVKSLFLHVLVCTTWSKKVQIKFQTPELFHADPVVKMSRTATGPFAWDLSIYGDDDPIQAQLKELRLENGCDSGICVPIIEAFQGRSVLYLGGQAVASSPDRLLLLHLIGQHFAGCINVIQGSLDLCGKSGGFFVSKGELSPRERQILGWIAFGRSSKDIGSIMSISEHTVNDHIANAVHKLEANNRTEAVMRALLTNQIDLS